MSRLQPISLFNTVFSDREDPNNVGNYLCRFCGKPTVKSRRKYYCSDECYWNCQKSLSWWFARDAVFKRDNGKCVKCGEKLNYQDTWDCHHVVPVKDLWHLAWASVFENPDWDQASDDDKARGYAIIYTILVHDINNLITLCPVCHKLEHASKEPEPEIENIITLDQFFRGSEE